MSPHHSSQVMLLSPNCEVPSKLVAVDMQHKTRSFYLVFQTFTKSRIPISPLYKSTSDGGQVWKLFGWFGNFPDDLEMEMIRKCFVLSGWSENYLDEPMGAQEDLGNEDERGPKPIKMNWIVNWRISCSIQHDCFLPPISKADSRTSSLKHGIGWKYLSTAWLPQLFVLMIGPQPTWGPEKSSQTRIVDPVPIFQPNPLPKSSVPR